MQSAVLWIAVNLQLYKCKYRSHNSLSNSISTVLVLLIVLTLQINTESAMQLVGFYLSYGQ